MSIIRKLMAAFISLAIVVAALSACMLYGFSSMRSTLTEVVEHSAKNELLASRFESDVQAMRGTQRGLELYSIAKNTKKTTAAKHTYSERSGCAAKTLHEIEALGVTPQEATLVQEAQAGLNDVTTYRAERIKLCASGDAEGAAQLFRSKTVSPFEMAAKPALQLVQIESDWRSASKGAA